MERIEIELDLREYVIKIGAEEMILCEPTLEQQFSFDAKLKGIDSEDPGKMYALYKEFLMELGAKADLVKKMSLRHIQKLTEAFTDKKK